MIQRGMAKVADGRDLTEAEMMAVMEQIMEGRATSAQIGGFLVGLRMKGEAVEEISGAAKVMRAKATPIPVNRQDGEVLVDTCGTGGDGTGTFNVSTTTALVVAGAGLKVAKHGNRSISSNCGSADLFEELGVNLDLNPQEVGACIDQAGIGFLFAPTLHQAMRFAMGPRKELGLRTIFNMLGPLTNPARAEVQIMGVYSQELVEPVAWTLSRLGIKSAFVVHGSGGYDEITITGPTTAARVDGEGVMLEEIDPRDLGMDLASPEEIKGGDGPVNAAITIAVLEGTRGAPRDMVLLNAGAAILAAGRAEDLGQGVALAGGAIDSGAALQKLNELRALTQAGGREANA